MFEIFEDMVVRDVPELEMCPYMFRRRLMIKLAGNIDTDKMAAPSFMAVIVRVG